MAAAGWAAVDVVGVADFAGAAATVLPELERVAEAEAADEAAEATGADLVTAVFWSCAPRRRSVRGPATTPWSCPPAR